MQFGSSKIDFVKLTKLLAGDKDRNKLISSKLKQMYALFDDFRCVVFSRFKDHNKMLYDMFDIEGACKFIVDGNHTKTNEEVLGDLPPKYVIFTTFS